MQQNIGKHALLIFSQPFWPDPAAVGQQLTDVAVELIERGYSVKVYTSNRGYDDPSIKYRKKETYKGVVIHRLGFSSFGKKNLVFRGMGVLFFIVQCILKALFTKENDGILFSTTPPFIGLAAIIAKNVRNIPVFYWAMDLNPDQLLMLGKISEKSIVYRALESVNRLILKHSVAIYTLDKYMGKRIFARGDFNQKMKIAPPWAHISEQKRIQEYLSNPFRGKHSIQPQTVVMYSGNHSIANPLTTLLEAAVQLKDDERVRFLFIGGGSGKAEVERYVQEHELRNVVSLPYEPIENLHNSLSAADVHVVSMGDKMVGIIHPCKVYGAMAVGKPILYLGPEPSHVSDILREVSCGWHVAHGDVAGCAKVLKEILASEPSRLRAMGENAARFINESLSKDLLCGNLCDDIGSILDKAPNKASAKSGSI